MELWVRWLIVVCLLVCLPTSAAAGESSSDEESDPPPPVSVSGHAMFRYTWKLDPADQSGAEIYNLRLYLDRSFEGISFHAEPRLRQTPLRSFSPSNVWIQQAWVAFDKYKERVGTLRAGLISDRTGLTWDNSWVGNLVYLNGLKLDPDYGIEAVGEPSVSLGGDRELTFQYGLQFLPFEDGLNGFFAPPSKLERLGATPASGWPIDFDSAPGFSERDMLVAELGPRLSIGEFAVRVGASVARTRLIREETDQIEASRGHDLTVGLEGEIRWAGLAVYAEWLRQHFRGIETSAHPGERAIQYGLAGIAYDWSREAEWLRSLQLRVNGSRVSYEFADAEEWFLAPGAHVRLHRMLGFTAEYVRWNFDGSRVVDRVEWVLHGYF